MMSNRQNQIVDMGGVNGSAILVTSPWAGDARNVIRKNVYSLAEQKAVGSTVEFTFTMDVNVGALPQFFSISEDGMEILTFGALQTYPPQVEGLSIFGVAMKWNGSSVEGHQGNYPLIEIEGINRINAIPTYTPGDEIKVRATIDGDGKYGLELIASGGSLSIADVTFGQGNPFIPKLPLHWQCGTFDPSRINPSLGQYFAYTDMTNLTPGLSISSVAMV